MAWTKLSIRARPAPRLPAGAENCVTACDQRLRRQPTSQTRLAGRPAGSLAVALRLAYLALARVLSWLALLAPHRGSQGRRGPGPASRTCRAAPTQPAPEAELGRPRAAQCAELAATGRSTTAAARISPGPAALARSAGRPPLDLPATTTRPITRRATHPGAGAADGLGESELGLPPHPGRAGRPRPSGGRVHRLDDPRSHPASTPLRDAPARPGASSSPRRHTRSSRSTSPKSTPPSCPASTSWWWSTTSPPRVRRGDRGPSHQRLGTQQARSLLTRTT
jgi:hypothetical protein